MFASNVGGLDRVLRIVAGAALILWFVVDRGGGAWHYAKLLGALPLLTGLFGTCPAYVLTGVSTRPAPR